MSAQSGILLEHCRAGIFIEAQVQDLAWVKRQCRIFLDNIGQLQHQYPDAGLGAVLAFGHGIWT